MKTKNILLTAAFSFAAAAGSLAQSPDKDHLGFYTIPGYPFCHMDNKNETYSMVTEHIVPIDANGPKKYIKDNLGLGYFTSVYSPDGADIVISVDNYFENYDYNKIVIMDASKPRPKPRREVRQTTNIKNPFLNWLLSDTKKEEAPAAPPAGPEWVAKGTKEVGFAIEVKSRNEIVFTDTIFYMQEIESAKCPNKTEAKQQVIDKMKQFNLASQMKAYQPFLSKVVGATPLTYLNFNGYGVRVKKKCTIDYSDINEALANFKEAYEFIKKRPWEIEEFKEMAAPSVKVWEEAISQADMKDPNAKVHKEVCAAMYYNMAVYSALSRDYKACVDYFKKADRAKLGFSDALQMSKLAQTWLNAQEAYDQMMAE
ncbi:MAG: hypothetical protein MJZ14_05145 [Paludibacteraceae bacterium]|nr:hypothetical protein [Paludibacteraceae bacterium]